ncbi:MAG: RNA degradosome polyphosphate kinase, partial [Vulcanococcus sp.]
MEEANQGAALFINRELSWIAFNQRVLNLAMDPETPLLEQAKFSAIFSNNLDEFFMVRIASLQSQIDEGITTESFDGLNPHKQLRSIRECLRPLLELQQQHYRLELKAKLNEQGIQILDYKQLSRKQKDWANSYFYRHVFPILTP